MRTISLAAIAAVLGMSAEAAAAADEEQILGEVKKLKNAPPPPPPASVAISGVQLLGVASETEATVKVQEFQRCELRLLAGTGKATLSEALVVVDGWKDDAAKRPEDAKTISRLTEEARVAKRDAAIAKLSESGHLPPARHEWAKQKFATADAVESFFEGMPTSFLAGGPTEPTNPNATVTLTDEERAVCKATGVTEEKFLEQKKLDLQRGSAPQAGV